MNDIEVSRVIAASPEELYDIVSDLPNMGRISPENTGGEWLQGATTAAVGARFKGTNSTNGKSWTTTAEIERADRGEAFQFRSFVGPMKIGSWGWQFEPVEGGTKVTESWRDLRNGLTKFIGGKASGVTDRQTFNRTNIEQTLAKLAELAEG